MIKTFWKSRSIVHEAGGLCYYDGANLNAVMGVARPGDMGFDVVHLNLHKTFATPHGGGGPGSGPVGCKKFLAGFLPGSALADGRPRPHCHRLRQGLPRQLPRGGQGAVPIWITLGGEGIARRPRSAVLNANYLMTPAQGRRLSHGRHDRSLHA